MPGKSNRRSPRHYDPTPELIEKAKRYYLETDIPLTSLSNLSQNLLGAHVAYITLKNASENDPKGSWSSQRDNLRSEKVENVSEEVSHIRKIIYEQITLQSLTGLTLTGEFDEAEVRKRLKGVDGLEIRRSVPRGVDSNMVSAYMNIISKAQIPLRIHESDGRTSREQAMQAISKAIMEYA